MFENPYFCNRMLYCQPLSYQAELAQAYIPYQHLTCIYPPKKGLKQGTIFPGLDKPYDYNWQFSFYE